MDGSSHVRGAKRLWANRPWGEMSIHWAKRPWGELSVGRKVLTPDSEKFMHTGTCSTKLAWLWPPCVIGQAIIFLPCGFFLSYIYLLMVALCNRADHYIFIL